MSISELNKTKNPHNESAHSLPITQKNSYHAIDMESVKKETFTPGSLTIAKSKDIVCIDVKENSIEQHTDANEEVDAGILANISQLKVHVIIPMVARRKAINELYDSMVDLGKQQLAKLTWRQEQPPAPPEQTVVTQDDRTQSLASLETQVPPSGPKYFQAQGWGGQGQAYGPGQGYGPGPVQPPQGWGQPQPPPYPQNPLYRQDAGYSQFLGYPQGQGYPPPQEYHPGAMLDYNPQDRNPFVALVMAVTCIMLATTAIFIGVIVLTPKLKQTFRRIGLHLALPSMIILIIVNYAFMCCAVARRAPCSIFLLILTVIGMSGVAGTFSVHYNTEIILQAVLATAIIVGLCTLLAFTNFDFTSFMLYIVMFGLVLFVATMIFFGVKLATGKKMTVLHLVLLVLSTLLQAVILVAELQMILGGKAIELHEDEWALGAYLLYTSIVNLFIKMLSILGIIGDD